MTNTDRWYLISMADFAAEERGWFLTSLPLEWLEDLHSITRAAVRTLGDGATVTRPVAGYVAREEAHAGASLHRLTLDQAERFQQRADEQLDGYEAVGWFDHVGEFVFSIRSADGDVDSAPYGRDDLAEADRQAAKAARRAA